jgi:hypothetical protein
VTRLRSLSPRALALIAAVVGVVVALAAFLQVMGRSAYRLTGTNSVVVPLHVDAAPGEEVCAPHVFVPAGSGAVAPWAGGPNGAPGGPVAVRIVVGGRTVVSGRSPASFPTGVTRLPLARTVHRDLPDARVCFTNRSRAHLYLYGDYVGPGKESDAAGNAKSSAILRIDWSGPHRESWWHVLGAMAGRFPLFKAPFLGPWAFWLVLAVVLGLSVAAVARVVRGVEP